MRGQGLARWSSLVAVLLFTGVVVGGVVSADTASGPVVADDNESTPVFGVAVDPDTVLLQVELQENGTGAVQVEYRIRLDDENTTAAFEQHQESITENPGEYRSAFATDMRSGVRAAANSTGREMAVSDVTVSATQDRLPQRYGIITYTFDWEGFAATNASAIVAGDALQGLYLDGETTLLVSWPDAYHRDEVAPEASERRENGIVWDGPMHFADDQPRVVVSSAGDPPADQGPGGESPGSGSPVPGGVPALIAGVVLVGVVGVGGWYFDYLEVPAVAGVGSDPDAELLSNEEQVATVLEDHSGRVKQQAIADELGWTDAKTSKVIRKMREEDAVETFRVGRENVVTFPDTDPDED